jgi:hypothetical protein
MTSTYTPRTDSLSARVIAFFQRNPDEELDLEAITDKFDATRGNIHTQLARALDSDQLKRFQNGDGDWIYKAGKNLLAAKPVVNEAAAPKPRRTIKPYEPINVDPLTVAIEDNIPIPNSKGQKMDWTPLLKRLKPGQSAALPIGARYTLANYVTQAKKDKLGEFTMRILKEKEQVRVWRTA